jgi:hypothetical protein
MAKTDAKKFVRDVLTSPGGFISALILLTVFYIKGAAPLMLYVGLGTSSLKREYVVDRATGIWYNLQGAVIETKDKPLSSYDAARFTLVVEYTVLSHLRNTAMVSVNGAEPEHINSKTIGDSGIYKTYRGAIPLGNEIDKRGIHIRLDVPTRQWRQVATTTFGVDTENVKWQRPIGFTGYAFVDQVALGLPADTFIASDTASFEGTPELIEHSYRPPIGLMHHQNLHHPEAKLMACDAVTLVDADIYPPAGITPWPPSPETKLGPDQMWRHPLPLEWRDGWVTDNATGAEEEQGTNWLRSLAHSLGIHEAPIAGRHTLHFPAGIPKRAATVSKSWKWDSRTLLEGYYLLVSDSENPLWTLRIKLPPELRTKHVLLEAYNMAGKSLGRFPTYPTIHKHVVEAKTLPMFSPTPISKVEIYTQDIETRPMTDGVVDDSK